MARTWKAELKTDYPAREHETIESLEAAVRSLWKAASGGGDCSPRLLRGHLPRARAARATRIRSCERGYGA